MQNILSRSKRLQFPLQSFCASAKTLAGNRLLLSLSRRTLSTPGFEELCEYSPWRFDNTDRNLIKRADDSHDDLIDEFQKTAIEGNSNGLATGIDFTFTELWEALSTRDMATIGTMCEGELRKSFAEFFDSLDEEGCTLQAEGDADHESAQNKIRLIDFKYVRGNFSKSREENRSL